MQHEWRDVHACRSKAFSKFPTTRDGKRIALVDLEASDFRHWLASAFGPGRTEVPYQRGGLLEKRRRLRVDWAAFVRARKTGMAA